MYVLSVIMVALALTVLVLSFVPNPLIKNRPWVSVEDILFYQEENYDFFTGAAESTTVYSFLIITIHNPTHSTPTFTMNYADLYANIYKLSSSSSQTFVYTPQSATEFTIFKGGNWRPSPVRWVELPACSPTVVEFDFFSDKTFPNSFNKGTFHLKLAVSISGVPAIFTDDWTTNFVSTPLQTTTTTTQMTGVYTPPNECLFPWV